MKLILTNIIAVLAILMTIPQTGMAQDLLTDSEANRLILGDPISAHYVGYAGQIEYEGEMIPWVRLGDVIVLGPHFFKNEKEKKKFYKIANNIKKVYPIACDIQKSINESIAKLDSLPDKRSKDEYMKRLEKDLMAQYKPRCKKLTLSQGKLLIKLIDRQCDQTSYQLIRTYMGKFKASTWNFFSSIFGASLKKEYDPEVDDRLTEICILLIESGQI